jgi:hypothetical protein
MPRHLNPICACRAFDSLAPIRSAFGLPVYVAELPLAPFCETPTSNRLAADTDALQNPFHPRNLRSIVDPVGCLTILAAAKPFAFIRG